MLSSLLGIRLVLLMGKSVPLPAPAAVSTALTQVEVTNDAQSGDGFQMTFTLGRGSPLDFGLIESGVLDPFTRVIICVALGATPEVLIDGIITHHQFAPSEDPGASTLTVTGRDVSVMLDLEEKSEKYDNQPDSVIFARIIGNYAKYGLVPMATPTTVVPIMVQRTPWQQTTDLKFIQAMAERNGFVFYVEPLAVGSNTAYFGPESRAGMPQPALTVGMGAWTNVKSINVTLDSLAPVGTKGSVLEPNTGTTLPIPTLPSLRVPPLVPSPTPASRTVLMRDTANQDTAQAAASMLAAATQAPDSVTCDGELETVRYGAVLRARRLTAVRGIGYTHDGLYYVRRVTHSISPSLAGSATYTQRFSLSREGTGSLTPVVMV